MLCDDRRVKRSDDQQQLEVVVQDLAQQVSANKAEILALKARLGTSASLFFSSVLIQVHRRQFHGR